MTATSVLRVRSCSGFFVEAVADVAHRVNEGVAGVLNLAAQPSHVHVHGTVATVVVVSPHTVEKDLSCVYPARVCGEEPEEFIFLEREFNQMAAE